MNEESRSKARRIITYVVQKTYGTVNQWSEEYSDLDRVFIRRGYEQGGFEFFKLAPLLEAKGIFSIERLGSILDSYMGEKKYNRQNHGALASSFFVALQRGHYGLEGVKFYECVKQFLERRLGRPGAFFWLKLWQMLVCLNYLKLNYHSSFVFYLKKKYADFKQTTFVSDSDLLGMTTEEWLRFKETQKPWDELSGIGENVFDFIVGDVAEFEFARSSYKLDAANSYFFKVTGLQKLIDPNFTRDTVIAFLSKLNLPFTIRQINAAIYAYCSVTEAKTYGFCHDVRRCDECGVNNICERNIAPKPESTSVRWRTSP